MVNNNTFRAILDENMSLTTAFDAVWLFIRDTLSDGDPLWILWVVNNIITAGLYTICTYTFFILDWYRWPKFLYQYKIQPDVHLDQA